MPKQNKKQTGLIAALNTYFKPENAGSSSRGEKFFPSEAGGAGDGSKNETKLPEMRQ